MSYLPTYSDDFPTGQPGRRQRSNGNDNAQQQEYSQQSVPMVIKRLFKTPKNLDLETASWEMFHLILHPRKAYRSIYYQRQTKNQWARDDPSFFIFQIVLISISSVIWSIYNSGFNNENGNMGFFGIIGHFFKSLIMMVFLDFFIFGFVMATIFYFLLNRSYFKFKSSQNTVVEWAYCFDVHCNSFLIILLCLYFIQFLLLPIINLQNWISLLIGNSLYCFAIGHYFILTFYGYNQLPFLKNLNFILLPTLGLSIIYLISLFGIDLSKRLSFYNY
ncbi:Gmh1p [Saccharomyces eubayanus]|uniref:Gmh1p n=1 Tax=Saccharomyces eubayanus TaxID=1080349 RepID=UPI0006C60D3C|nr:GMH1-like protein [Saccharomyces eubayanus]KOG98347.1 GMH1-like protein [Saccharomyces eubayanus]